MLFLSRITSLDQPHESLHRCCHLPCITAAVDDLIKWFPTVVLILIQSGVRVFIISHMDLHVWKPKGHYCTFTKTIWTLLNTQNIMIFWYTSRKWNTIVQIFLPGFFGSLCTSLFSSQPRCGVCSCVCVCVCACACVRGAAALSSYPFKMV